MTYSSSKLLSIVEEAGISDETLSGILAPMEISLEAFTDADRLFTRDEIFAIFRGLIAHVSNEETLFRAGQRFSFTSFGVFGLAVMSQSDLRSAMEFTMRYRPLSSPIIGLDLPMLGDESAMVFSPLPGTEDDHDIYPRLLDFNLGLFISLMSDAIGRSDFVSRIHLSPAAGPMTGALLTRSGYDVVNGASQDAIVLEPWAMDSPLRLKSTVGAAQAKKLCGDALANLEASSTFSAEVQAVMIANIEKPMTAAFVARRMGMSERSLRRRLEEEKLSFRALKQSVQTELARRYLRETRMTVSEISRAVGYSDVANFRRAFRTLLGRTPQQYRMEESRFGG